MMKNKQVFRNTIMLYARQLLIIIVSLYSVRIVLNTMGVEDFGIYSVVATVVTLCSFLSGSLGSSAQRYFSFALGKNDEKLLQETFSTTLIIYFVICIIAFIILKIIGTWAVVNYLTIPIERREVALLLYNYSLATFIFSILTSPFIAIIIAHEDMHLYALISIFEAIMKLTVVYLLSYIDMDKLVLYGVLLLMVSIVNALVYIGACKSKYVECQFRSFHWNRRLFKDIYVFTGWTLFGQLSTIARNQAITIMLNQFFNPTVVAARAISTNVASQVSVFASKFNTGLYPPIIKSYANNDKDELFTLIFIGSKLTFILMWIFSLPLISELEFVLTLWLGTFPLETILFTKLALVESLLFSLSLPVATAARAPGKMKLYELTLGSLQFAIMIISYFCLKNGGEAYTVFLIAIIINIIMFIIRLYIVSYLIGLSVGSYMKRVIIPVVTIVILSSVFSLILEEVMPLGILYSLINIVSIGCCIVVLTYVFALEESWKVKIKDNINRKLDILK